MRCNPRHCLACYWRRRPVINTIRGAVGCAVALDFFGEENVTNVTALPRLLERTHHFPFMSPIPLSTEVHIEGQHATYRHTLIHTHSHSHTYTHTHTHSLSHTHTHSYTHTPTHVYPNLHTHSHTYTLIQI